MDQVVCIHDDWRDRATDTNSPLPSWAPRCGDVYTVTVQYWADDLMFFRFAEIRKGWQADCFRLVRKTDISVFTAMLRSAPCRETRRAIHYAKAPT